MKKGEKRERVFHSIIEVEREFLPRSFEERMSKEPEDTPTMGISLVEESLDKIRERLAG